MDQGHIILIIAKLPYQASQCQTYCSLKPSKDRKTLPVHWVLKLNEKLRGQHRMPRLAGFHWSDLEPPSSDFQATIAQLLHEIHVELLLRFLN